MERQKYTLNPAKHASKMTEWRIRIGECRNSGRTIKEWRRENHICIKNILQMAADHMECRGRKRSKYTDYEIRLDPGDTVFVYTDGITEASDDNQTFLSGLQDDRSPEYTRPDGTG